MSSLAAGTRLGAYEVVAPLGAGGMGEVYRARDTKLGRDVAIKILPDQFVSDAERLARFEREARTLASLNHPNIAQIYGLEDPATGSGHGRALVMELVEGEDLATVLSRGKLRPDDALPMARQIAQALEAAHELGIIHRDLKPANIRVRADGTVKVLDFGLAKALDPSGTSSASLANSPTITSPATELGTILGTAAYMSPEQARGKAVDRRADVWAFGAVLYEMLTGRRAFEGGEVSDVLASVLKDPIAFDALPPDLPPAIRRLLRRCLEKNRADRLDSMATARLEIAEALSPNVDKAESAGATATTPQPAWGRALSQALIAGGIVVGLAVGWVFFRSEPAPDEHVVRFSVVTPPGLDPNGVAITSSGETIVYSADRIYVRGLSDAAPRAVAGTEGARMVFLSPDGRLAGFFAGGKIKKVALSGGDALTITSADVDTPGGSWGPGNTILFSPGWNAPLHSVSADGAVKSVAISTVDTAAGELGHWWPEALPDGKTVLFTDWMAATGINDAKIAALDLASGKHRVLMPGSHAKYLTSGHLLYFHAGSYQVAPFDPVAVRVTGESRKVLPDALPIDPGGSRVKPIAVSASGTLAYLAGPLLREVQLAWVSPAGVVDPIAGPPLKWGDISLSPDGRRIAGASLEGGTRVLWLRDLLRQTDERIDAPGANFAPHWSPTGDFLVFTSMRVGHYDAYMLRLAEGAVRPIIDEPYDQEPAVVTHDGKRMVLFDYLSDGSGTISIADLDHPKPRARLALPAGTTQDLEVSLDDKWLATVSTASGRAEVVVQPFTGAGAAVPVSSRGGMTPRWSSTGSKLYYRRDDEMVVATYSTAGGRFVVEREDTLFRLPGYNLIGIVPDGRFLMAKDLPRQSIEIQAVVNWFGELKK